MVILGQRWAETYMKENAGITVQVTGGGSGTGIAALINGAADVCESSRPMKDKEKEDLKAKRNADAVETKVALDALAVYVNAKSPVREISIPQLAKIYLGETHLNSYA
jgi:phosphate transport system substrate-binding protein